MRNVKEVSQGFVTGFAKAFVADMAVYGLIIASLLWTLWMVT